MCTRHPREKGNYLQKSVIIGLKIWFPWVPMRLFFLSNSMEALKLGWCQNRLASRFGRFFTLLGSFKLVAWPHWISHFHCSFFSAPPTQHLKGYKFSTSTGNFSHFGTLKLKKCLPSLPPQFLTWNHEMNFWLPPWKLNLKLKNSKILKFDKTLKPSNFYHPSKMNSLV
jgi:hypothetical protein